jgi:hypothetical protein
VIGEELARDLNRNRRAIGHLSVARERVNESLGSICAAERISGIHDLLPSTDPLADRAPANAARLLVDINRAIERLENKIGQLVQESRSQVKPTRRSLETAEPGGK